MIVVFEPNMTERSATLRGILLSKGYPCAVCDAATIKSLAPMLVIITFTEHVDAIRSLPYDHIPVIAYGEGFVNRAVNAVKAETVDALLMALHQTLYRYLEANDMPNPSGEGVFCAPGVYVAWNFIMVYGVRLRLAPLGVLLLRCLIFSGSHYRNAEQLAAYCCSGEHGGTGSIRVYISHMNLMASVKLQKPLVECKHGVGYLFGYLREGDFPKSAPRR